MRKSNALKRILGYKITAYAAAFCYVFFLFLIFRFLGIKNNYSAARSFMIIEYAALFGMSYYLRRKDIFTNETLISFIFAAGMILGVGNMLGTHIFQKGYDQGFVSSEARGHFGYILNLVKGQLPKSNAEQYYQPPLFHFAASVFVRLGMVIENNNAEEAIQFTQILNSAVYCFMMIALRRFIPEINLKEKHQKYVSLLIAFYPNFILMGLRGNNDMFAAFFMLLCVINTYRWYKRRDMKTIICIAFSFGLGMMSKISVGIMAIITGPVMLYCLVKDLRQKQYKEIISQLAVFAAICIPVALWYPIRNLILFDQPLSYVQRLDESTPIFLGDIKWYKQFFGLNTAELIKQPFFIYPERDSVVAHLLKTSLFGEWSYPDNAVMCSVFMSINIITIIASLAAMIVVLIKGKTIDKELRFGFFAVWAIMIISYIQFNISYKFVCTADFRYIVLTEIIGAVYMGYAMQTTDNKAIQCIIKGCIIAFTVCSAAIYI